MTDCRILFKVWALMRGAGWDTQGELVRVFDWTSPTYDQWKLLHPTKEGTT